MCTADSHLLGRNRRARICTASLAASTSDCHGQQPASATSSTSSAARPDRSPHAHARASPRPAPADPRQQQQQRRQLHFDAPRSDMQTSIRLNQSSGALGHQRPVLAAALVSLALLLIHSSLQRIPLAAEAGPTQTLVAGSGAGGGTLGAPAAEPKGIFKRSFAGLGCLGVYDKAKFARLDRVCEECYTLYREPDIHSACRQDCFRNSVFTRCVDALLLSHEAKKFDEMVDELYGK